jgi:hypothetical protein
MSLQNTIGRVVVWILAGAAPVLAQCASTVRPGQPVPGPATGTVRAAIPWDPDGPGPASERLVIAGEFTFPGLRTNHIACYDPATGAWSSLGGGCSHGVNALAALPNGDLVAVGGFLAAGGVPAFCVARWDGAAWHAIGNGLPGSGNAVVVQPNGDLVVGCWSTPGQPSLVRWNGSAWVEFAGYVDGAVHALAQAPNGDLYVGGTFVSAAGQFLSRLARWDGSAWHHVGHGVQGAVGELALLPNGDLIVGGTFPSVGNLPQVAWCIARWDGTQWSPLGAGSSASVQALHVLPNGDLLAGGEFQVVNGPATNLARWDGAQWHTIDGRAGGPGQWPSALCTMANGDLVVGGNFDLCGGVVVAKVARRRGTVWQALGTGPDDRVQALAVDAAGDVHVGGLFELGGGRLVRSFAHVQAGIWRAPTVVSSGISYHSYYGPVESIVRLADGRLAATTFGGYDQRSIALWDGQAWTPTTAKVNYDVRAITETATGDLVIGGDFLLGGGRVARLAGTSWQPLGALYSNTVRAVLGLPDGSVAAGGGALSVGGAALGHVARWNGVAWQPLGHGLGTNYGDLVRCLARLPNGDLVAAGTFIAPGVSHVARWNGSAWSALGSGLAGGVAATAVHALLVLPDGDLLVGGDFTLAGGVPVQGLARWDGANWSAVDSGVDGVVYAMTLLPDGDLLVGGDFAHAGGLPNGHLARIESSCVARIDGFGSGCTNGLGLVRLVGRDLPWLGGTYRATCDQVPAGAFAFVVRGFQATAVPLSAFHPAAGAGCLQLAREDSVQWLLPAAGRVTTALVIPNDPGLLAVQLVEQVVIAEVSPALAVTGLSSSNGVRLTVGRF